MDGDSAQRAAPRGALRLCTVRRVPVYVTPSWLLVSVFLTLAYVSVVRDTVPSAGRPAAYAASFSFALAFGLCVLAHECGHTLVSLALGHPVRRIVLFALGGVSEFEDEPDRPRDELLIAAAGPLVSLALGGGAYLATLWLDPHDLSGAVLGLIAWSNLLIAAFNLLPGLPLDGGRIVRATLACCRVPGTAATMLAGWTGRGVAALVAVAGLFADRTAWGLTAGLVSLVLAAYLWSGAGAAMSSARLTAALPDVDVSTLLRSGLFVPSDVSVAEALRRAWERDVRGIVLLDGEHRPAAIVDESRVMRVPAEQRPWVQVSAVARPLSDGVVLPEGVDAAGLLRHMRHVPANEYLLLRADGSPAGIVATRDFAGRLSAASRARRGRR